MKETRKSLKAYFIVVGILGILSIIDPIVMTADILTKAISITITLVISVMFIFYGVKLYDYLQTSPKTIVNFIVISLGIRVLLGLLAGQWIIIVLILLGWYLIHNVKKLSTQPSVVDNRK